MSQIALPLAWPADADTTAFLVGEGNRHAVEHLRRWGRWPVAATLLVGPPRSGRSLLGRSFVAATGGRLVDNAQSQSEEALFHAWNRAQESRRPLLIVADAAPPAWTPALADLRSRLAATPVIRIEAPDDALLCQVIDATLSRRGLQAPPELLRWLTPRIERSYPAAALVADVLDGAALGSRRRLSIPLARTALTQAGLLVRTTEPDRDLP